MLCILRYIMSCNLLFYSFLFYYILFYSILFCSITLHYILLYYIILYYIISYHIILYYIILVVGRSGWKWVSLRSTHFQPLQNNILTIGLRPLMLVSHSFNMKFNQVQIMIIMGDEDPDQLY